MERVTDEEAGEGGWFWNEQVGSFRPPGALYCRECGVLIQGMWGSINFILLETRCAWSIGSGSLAGTLSHQSLFSISCSSSWPSLLYLCDRYRDCLPSKIMIIYVRGLGQALVATTCGRSRRLSLASTCCVISALLLSFGHCWMDLLREHTVHSTRRWNIVCSVDWPLFSCRSSWDSLLQDEPFLGWMHAMKILYTNSMLLSYTVYQTQGRVVSWAQLLEK